MKVQNIAYCTKINLLIIIALLSTSLFAGDFYENDAINIIGLKFADDNWDAELDAIYEKDSDSDGEYDRLSCTATLNGIEYEQVGVRYKGNSSYSANNAKNPFNIKLDYMLEQDYEGYGTLKLSNVHKDPSFVRETLSYEIARKYMPASKANYMKVYIYNYSSSTYVYHGLYTNVEAVDKKFFAEHFSSNDNARFKCNPSDTWSPQTGGTGASLDYLGTDASLYSGSYQLKTDDIAHWDDLIALTYDIKYDTPNLDNAIDLDQAIWMLAYDNVLVNLDSYIGPSRQNYYLYKCNDNRWATILWDLNESFGGFTQVDSGGGHPGPGQTDISNLDPLLRQGDSGWPLLNIILSDSTYKNMYIAHMRTIIKDNFSNGWYKTRALEIQSVIDSDVAADTNKIYTYYDCVNNIDYNRGGVTGIAELMGKRVTYLNSQSALTATVPTITSINVSSYNPAANSSVLVNVDANNANTVTLAYRYANTGKFVKLQMSDDGNNNDGTAGDGTYGVSLPIANTNVQCYFYVENNNAGVFSPERAEHEFYTLEVSQTSVVINEFMAENDTTIQDPDGGAGYPDWIELYNPGQGTVDLGGMYLTDDLSQPTQWQIPEGISIAPGDYVLFWADNDEDQGAMHTNFKLSKSGEAIGLFDSDANGNALIDSITYGLQTADVSYGRIGDGDDNWQAITSSSPGGANPSLSDLDGNGVVDLLDFALLCSHWQNKDCGDCDGVDITGDGSVDIDDLLVFCTDWMKGL
ncbi:MAG: CotH kinase family protein [Phycisphaerae bacterium]|nr:CotH kinase family protein [Phycisphaerae bacterium]